MNRQLKTLIKQTNKKPPQYRTESTWLPVFPGFYNTVFDAEEDYVRYETEMALDEKREYYSAVFSEGVTEEFFDEYFWECLTDREYAMEAVCESICEALKTVDPIGVIKAVEYERLSSPKFYNFSNDSINCKITFDQQVLQKYVDDNIEAFTEFIEERYTSRSGFVSSHSNNVEDWRDMSELGEHSTGSVLEFVFLNEYQEDAQWQLYVHTGLMEAFGSNIGFDTEEMIQKYKLKIE